MLDRITFNDILFSDYHTFYDGSQLFDMPEKDVEFFSVPGRNGDLSISNDRYKNVNIKIKCFIRNDFISNYNNLINMLSSQDGYGRLETSKEPDIYREAQFLNAVSPNTGAFLKYGNFELEFNCKPQKFLKSGEHEIDVTSGATVLNPTQYNAKPLFLVNGTGSITVNESQLNLSMNTGITYIDCDMQNAYQGTINRNANLTVTNGFPVLKPNENNVVVSGFNNVLLIPRWWRL